MKVFVKGLNACGMRKTNVGRYRDFLVSCGHTLVDDPGASDAVILWTCAFRTDYRDNSIAEIMRYQKEFGSRLIVAGCLPDIDMKLLRSHFDGTVINWRNDEELMGRHFAGNDTRLSDVPRNYCENKLCDDLEKFRKEHPRRDASFIDQFIKVFVAEGCNFECSYCAERLAFPPYHSFPEEEIVESCRNMVGETGNREVILLGDSLGDYGMDIGTTLPNLIRKLSSIDPRLKIALQGFNPRNFIQFFDEMSAFIRGGIIRHMQLPIQSASEGLLKAMRRPYGRADIDRIFSFLNEVGFKEFDTHLIIGFPGETEEDAGETVDFILRHRPKYVLLSKFMEAVDMPASALSGKIDDGLKISRLRRVEKRIREAGIICNSDDSSLSKERCRRLNLA